MIKVENVTKAFGGDLLLDGVTFKLNRGEKCGLVGSNGSGKTTLLRLLTGEESPDSGNVVIPNLYKIGYLTQHLRFTKNSLLEEACEALPDDQKEAVYKAETILFGLGFKEEQLAMSPLDFSGGYQLRIHLAKVILQEPDCLLLDEPTNYLDIVSIRWFIRFLNQWKGEFIVISHDRDFMDRVTTHTLGIHRKVLKKVTGGTENYYTQLLQAEEIHEQTRLNLEKKKAKMEAFITKLGAKATKASQAQSRRKAIDRMPVLEELAKLSHLDFKFPLSPIPGRSLLKAEGLYFGYNKSEDPLIKDFSLSLEKGDRVAVIGKNGRGKSTILRLLAGDLQPDKGEIKISGNTRIGFFGQTNIDRLRPDLTIEEEITSARPNLSFTEVRKICGAMLFSGDRAKKKIGVLSGGERSRVLLGKILASPTNLLLLDEPTNHLDMESIEALVTALQEFEGGVVLVTHSEMLLQETAHRFVICHEHNQTTFLGSYEEFLDKVGWEKEIKKEKKVKPQKEDKEIQKQIHRLEKEIFILEKEISQETEALLILVQKGEREGLTSLQMEISKKQEQLDLKFKELEKKEIL